MKDRRQSRRQSGWAVCLSAFGAVYSTVLCPHSRTGHFFRESIWTGNHNNFRFSAFSKQGWWPWVSQADTEAKRVSPERRPSPQLPCRNDSNASVAYFDVEDEEDSGEFKDVEEDSSVGSKKSVQQEVAPAQTALSHSIEALLEAEGIVIEVLIALESASVELKVSD